MRHLILGVGFIGSALAARLIVQGDEVIGFDDLSSTDEGAIRELERGGSFQFVAGDICSAADLARVFALGPFGNVFFLAGQSSANDAVIPIERTEAINLLGARLVFDACATSATCSIVFGSSLRVYGQPLPAIFDESTGYGIQRDMSHLSKIYTEKLLEMYAQRWEVRAVSARLAIVYGLSPVMKSDYSYMTVANRFALQASRGETLQVAAQAGEISLLHVEDAAQALIECAKIAIPGFSVVNVLGDWVNLTTLAQLVVAEGLERGLTVEATIPPYRPQFVPDGQSKLDSTEFRRQRDLASGVRELLDFYLANRADARS